MRLLFLVLLAGCHMQCAVSSETMPTISATDVDGGLGATSKRAKCPEPAGAAPGSCGLKSLTTGERCVVCSKARACVDSNFEWCTGALACDDPLCKAR